MSVRLISKDELQIVSALRQFEFLRGMSSTHFRKLASITQVHEYPEGTILHQAGDIGKSIYLVEEGQVNIEVDPPGGQPVTVLKIEAGQVFGLSSLFPPQRKMGRAKVVRPTRALVIDAERLRELFKGDHELERAFLNRTAAIINQRVKATWLELAHRTVEKTE
ncbi:MAG: Crp/Fnr family transcriptional regulator [Chloroflexi bacterium]|nr:MAG: Crp/Fnr family transcriptional regulator [Chloroflexota bacterium]